MADEVGTLNVRKEFVDGVIKQIAARAYKFKQAVSIVPTDAWDHVFFQEDTTVLTGRSGNLTRGLPRGALFPQRSVELTKVTKTIEKYGLEDNIFWEDIISNNVDLRDRTLIKIAEGVIKSVDDEIWEELTEAQVPSAIQSITLTTRRWDVSSAAIIDDLSHARQLIAEQNIPTENLMAFISAKDHRSIVTFLTDKGAQFPKVSEGTLDNGIVGKLNGITLVQSNSVTASFALVVVPKRVGTWKALKPLTTITKEDPMVSITIRSSEFGKTLLTDPKAAVLIIGTQDRAGQ